ncbi:MAG: PadR family transcriptional regulator [Asgard group archaeon]|nr:PadR family transcriptional regulator [Asgard group archaeon]
MKENLTSKYEEKLARKLGEIAILIHLARSPEGSHAYEMCSKASDILYEKRRNSLEFIDDHIKTLHDLQQLITKNIINTDEYNSKRRAIEKSIEDCPIFKLNPRIKNLLTRDKEDNIKKDLAYLSEITKDLEKSVQEIKSMTTIWSNISGIYPAIESLEKSGLIEYVKDDKEGGRLKKIYQITELGRNTLARLLINIIDITGFVFHVDDKHFMPKKQRKVLFFNPFGDVFRRLADDIPHEDRKYLLHHKGKQNERPFSRMFMEHGLPLPSFRVFLRHPGLVKEHLDRIESEDERELAKEYLKIKLVERKESISKLLKELN